MSHIPRVFIIFVVFSPLIYAKYDIYEQWRKPTDGEVKFESYFDKVLPIINRYIVSERFYNITRILSEKTKGIKLHWWKVKFLLENTNRLKNKPFGKDILPKLNVSDSKQCNAIIILNPWNTTFVFESFNCQNSEKFVQSKNQQINPSLVNVEK